MPSAIGVNQDAIALRTSRPQSLIFTIYGAYSRSLGGWISVATLLKLLREMDIEDNAVRSALSRLKRRGVLISESRDGSAGYALSESARKAFDTGDARVLERRHPDEQTRSDSGSVFDPGEIPRPALSTSLTSPPESVLVR